MTAATLQAASNSHAKLFGFQLAAGVPADQSPVPASSAKLTRGDGVVWIRINTTELPAGAYTTWWVVFNNPDACVDGCDAADFQQNGGDPAVMASVFFATGALVGQSGVGHFDAHLEEGVLPTLDDQIRFGPGLLNAQDAEIHMQVKYHGPVSPDPEVLEQQLTTFSGGCDSFPCFIPQAMRLPRP